MSFHGRLIAGAAYAFLTYACAAGSDVSEQLPGEPAGQAEEAVTSKTDCERTPPNGSRPNCLHRYWTGTVCVVGDRYDGDPCYEGRRCTNGHACRVIGPDKCTCS